MIYWDCFSYTDLSLLIEVPENLNQYSCIELLSNQILLFVLHLSDKMEHFTIFLPEGKLPHSPTKLVNGMTNI